MEGTKTRPYLSFSILILELIRFSVPAFAANAHEAPAPMRLMEINSPYRRCKGVELWQNQPPSATPDLVPGNLASDPGRYVLACRDDPSIVPESGLLIRTFGDVVYWKRAGDFALAISREYEDIAQDNAKRWKHIQGCLIQLHNRWDALVSKECRNDMEQIQETRSKVEEVRVLQALAYSPHPRLGGTIVHLSSHLSDWINYRLSPVPGWILREPKSPLLPKTAEFDDATRAFEFVLKQIKSQFIQKMRQSQSHAFNPHSLKAPLKTLEKDSAEASLRNSWPAWSSFLDHTIASYQKVVQGELRGILDHDNLLAFLSSSHPSPQEMSEAIDKVLEMNNAGMRKVANLADRVRKNAPNALKAIHQLNSDYPLVVDQVLAKNTGYCGIATGILLQRENIKTGNSLMTALPMLALGLFSGSAADLAEAPALTTLARAAGIANAIGVAGISMKEMLDAQKTLDKALQVAFTATPGGRSVVSPTQASEAAQDAEDARSMAVSSTLLGVPILLNVRGALGVVRSVFVP